MIDLNNIIKPDIVEALNFDAIFADILQNFRERNPEFDAILESDPAIKLLEVCAYRELILRARINHACQALMLAYASGSDLDQLAANVNLIRLVIDAGDANATPPRPQILETDAALKRRILLQFEKITGAGPRLSYIAHALGADASIIDAEASTRNKQNEDIAGTVFISVLTREGIADASVLTKVQAICSAENVRPLCDTVVTQSADIIDYAISINLVLNQSFNFEQEKAKALERLNSYVSSEFMLGREITKAGIDAAAKTAGVHDVIIIAPAANIKCKKWQAPKCANITIEAGGYYE